MVARTGATRSFYRETGNTPAQVSVRVQILSARLVRVIDCHLMLMLPDIESDFNVLIMNLYANRCLYTPPISRIALR